MNASNAFDDKHPLNDRLDLFNLLLEEEGLEDVVLPTIQPRQASASTAPLSFAQQRLWFVDQLGTAGHSYNIAFGYHLHGLVDTRALQMSLNEIIRRHEILRTSFHAEHGEPFQQIHPPFELELHRVDFSTQDKAHRISEAYQYIKKDFETSFDLEQIPLLRAAMVDLDFEQSFFFVTLHHILADEWSINVFLEELGSLYTAFSSGEPASLPELSVQYADFAIWQRQHLQDERYKTLLAYWKNNLGDNPTGISFPTDRPRPIVQTFHGAVHAFNLDEDLTAKIRQLSQQEDCTLFMTFLAAFQVLMFRYTGQTNILVGCPVANRNQAETEQLIGFFVNSLVLRTNITARSQSFRSLLKEVRHTALGAFAHQDMPFEKLVQEIQPERNLNQNPLFQVMFSLQGAGRSQPQLGKLRAVPLKFSYFTSKFDLTFFLEETTEGFSGLIEYNVDLFDLPTMERLAAHYQTLLAGISVNPDCPLGDLPLLTEVERQQICSEWNPPGPADFSFVSLQQLFEARAAKYPARTALLFENQPMSYETLNSLANQLAHQLVSLGVGPDVRVGVCLERSFEMVIAIWAVLKAGGAYVPLDPSYPKERLQYMLVDSKTAVILTHTTIQDKLPSMDTQIVFIDADLPGFAGQNWENLNTKIDPQNLAYVIYTSGTTGNPKGVQIPHKAISNHMAWIQTEFQFRLDDIFFQKTPFSFDASVWEFFAPLLIGASLVIARPGGHQDPDYMIDTINRHQVSVLQLVPSMLTLLLEEDSFASCRSLRHVFCGGEALRTETVERFFQALQANLHNLYGPTEVTIDATFATCTPHAPEVVVPIGSPIHQIQAYILDEWLQLAPIGVAGELYLSGEGLSRGYLDQPGLTAEKFIPNPFGQSGSRLYKTGDLCRLRPNGNIEYLGRRDHQVKLRGFRIELSEIEAALLKNAAVAQALVIVAPRQPGNDISDQKLVAYIVCKETQHFEPKLLKSFLEQKLPVHMIPTAWVKLPEIPLSPNGKVDRSRLPAPEPESDGLSGGYVPPQNEIEHQISAIWQEVLNLSQVGIHDNFFDLGGHSLLLIRVQSRLNKIYQHVAIVDMFRYPTIATLAQHLSSQANNQPHLQQAQDRAHLQRKALEQQRQRAQLRREKNG